MPKLDGISATTQIRQFDAMTPIISMTSNTTNNDIMTYFANGMNDILPKPFSKAGLLNMLEKHCQHLRYIKLGTNQDEARLQLLYRANGNGSGNPNGTSPSNDGNGTGSQNVMQLALADFHDPQAGPSSLQLVHNDKGNGNGGNGNNNNNNNNNGGNGSPEDPRSNGVASLGLGLQLGGMLILNGLDGSLLNSSTTDGQMYNGRPAKHGLELGSDESNLQSDFMPSSNGQMQQQQQQQLQQHQQQQQQAQAQAMQEQHHIAMMSSHHRSSLSSNMSSSGAHTSMPMSMPGSSSVSSAGIMSPIGPPYSSAPGGPSMMPYSFAPPQHPQQLQQQQQQHQQQQQQHQLHQQQLHPPAHQPLFHHPGNTMTLLSIKSEGGPLMNGASNGNMNNNSNNGSNGSATGFLLATGHSGDFGEGLGQMGLGLSLEGGMVNGGTRRKRAKIEVLE